MLLRAKGIHKSYRIGPERLHVLRGASLSAEKGEFICIMGASGSGKSTFLHVLGALDTPDSGTVAFDGLDLFSKSSSQRDAYRNHNVGFVFQFYHLLPELNVLENVMAPRLVGCGFSRWFVERRKARRDAEEMLERVRLSDRAKHRPRELSGGERQRVAIARALVNRPALLLADEPTGNLDAAIGAEIMDLLSEFSASGQTIVMVTHDPAVSGRAHRRLQLIDGGLQDGGTGRRGRQNVDAPPTEVAR